MQFLNPIVDFAALTVHVLIDAARGLSQVGDDEPTGLSAAAGRPPARTTSALMMMQRSAIHEACRIVGITGAHVGRGLRARRGGVGPSIIRRS